MTIHTYDPHKVTLLVGGNIIHGYADDDFIEVERDEDAWQKKVGVDGEITRAKSNNKSGKIIVRLMQSSTANGVFTIMALADEAGIPGGVLPVLMQDYSGVSVFTTDSCWVKKFPKTTWKKGVAVWEWTLDTGVLDISIGGN